MSEKNSFVREVAEKKYEYGFTTDVQTDIIEKGLSEDVVRLISQKKGEPDWLLEFRLNAYRYWLTLEQPTWGHLSMPPIDYQAISYYADPTKKQKDAVGGSAADIDPELMKTFDKLGIPLEERMALAGTAVDAVMDSVSVKTTFREKLRENGIIFCSISEAVREHPDLVREYLGSVVPYRDNFFAALNSAVFSDGSFVYIPKGVRCPMELSTYFRINARGTGQFERTLIVCDDDAYVSYLEGCTAPMRDENQLHAAIVEIVVVQKKMKIHLEDLSNKDKIDRFLLYGELLSANIYLLKRGQKSAEVLNYYTGENIEIPMDQKLSPSSNVNSYFRRAQKLKTAASLSKEKYEQEKDEAGFLENLVYDIDASKTMEDLSDIRNILINYKYIDTDARTKKIKQRDPLEDPIEYTTTSGKKVLVGRNSRQNEVLTLRIADGDDMWFHVKDMPGSHVILFTGGKEPTEQDIYECAIYASRHSRHNDLNKVNIDYTEARNVWKEKGSRLGMVLYRNYRTIVVNPTDRI